MSDDFARRHTERDNALDSCGIGHDVEERFHEGTKAIAATAGKFVESAHNQLAYDLLTNKPCGVDFEEQTLGRHAIEIALAHTVGALVEWDIYEARRIAAMILEDVNDHEVAGKLFELAKGGVES